VHDHVRRRAGVPESFEFESEGCVVQFGPRFLRKVAVHFSSVDPASSRRAPMMYSRSVRRSVKVSKAVASGEIVPVDHVTRAKLEIQWLELPGRTIE
jgi:hypothetical protein